MWRVLTVATALAACGQGTGARQDANDASPSDVAAVDGGPTADEVLSDLCDPQGPIVQFDRLNLECPKGTAPSDAVDLDRDHASAVCRAAFKPFVDAGTIRLDVSAVQACKDYAAALTCADIVPLALTPCSLVFDGQQQQGEACQITEQCPSGMYCRLKNNCGRCEPLAMQLSYCTDHEDCVTGYCLNLLCQTRGDVGAPCQSHADCTGSLVCAQDVCAEVPSEGDGCDVARQFADACGYPDSGLFCRTSTAQCVREGLAGEPCDDYIDAPCNPRLWCDAGVCAQPTIAALSEPCQPPLVTCEPGLVCRFDSCAELGQIGEPCDDNTITCEPPLVCRLGTCAVAGSAPACTALRPAEPLQ